MRGTLQGHSKKLLEGSTVKTAKQLGLSQPQVFQARKRGLVKPSTKTAKAVTRDKFTWLMRIRGDRLTAKQRRSFEMVYFERMTTHAAAARLGISPVAVSDRLGRARLNLTGWPNREMVRILSNGPAWERLTGLQKRLLTLRYGLEAGLKPQSYGECAQQMGRSKGWALQAMVFSLNKLLFDE
jgi:hypothetical protein